MEDVIRCPICGKPMKINYHYRSTGGLGDWDWDDSYSEFGYLSCRCKECNVSFKTTTRYFGYEELYNLDNWKLPKGFSPTITEKQYKCIYAISNTLKIIPDPCFTLELATSWIGNHMQKSKDTVAEKLHDDDIETILRNYGYNHIKDFREFYDYHNLSGGTVHTEIYDLYTEAYQQIAWNRKTKKLEIDVCLKTTDSELKFRLTCDPTGEILLPSFNIKIFKQMMSEIKNIIKDINQTKGYTTQDVDAYLEEERKNRPPLYFDDYEDDRDYLIDDLF